MVEHRQEFQRELEAIEAKVIELFSMVAEDLPGATRALLSGDHEVVRVLAEREKVIDALYPEMEGKYSEVLWAGMAVAGVAGCCSAGNAVVIAGCRVSRAARVAGPRRGGLRGWRSRSGTVPERGLTGASHRCARMRRGRTPGRPGCSGRPSGWWR
jgi:hypothetical protein